MNIKLALAGLVVAAGLAAPASAYSPYSYSHHVGFGGGHSWQFLGAREVSHFSERDRIFAQGNQRFSQVKICVSNRAVRMLDILREDDDTEDINGATDEIGSDDELSEITPNLLSRLNIDRRVTNENSTKMAARVTLFRALYRFRHSRPSRHTARV